MDLIKIGVDIHDWWNRTRREDGALKLSSRRLLALISKLPDRSLFKAEWRRDWSQDQYTEAAILNEIRIMRAENAVFAGREYREPMLVKSPRQQEADRLDAELKDDIRAGIRAQLYRKLNKTGE